MVRSLPPIAPAGYRSAIALITCVAALTGLEASAQVAPQPSPGPTLFARGDTVSDGPSDALAMLPDGRPISRSALLSAFGSAPLDPGGVVVYDIARRAASSFDSAGGPRTAMLDENPAVFDVCVHDPALGSGFVPYALYVQQAGLAANVPLRTVLAKAGVIALAGSPVPCVAEFSIAAEAPADTTPPALTLPGPAEVSAVDAGGAPFTYAATAVDAVDGPRPVSCSPPSGTIFPLGITLVECSATDLSGNTANGGFTVTVVDRNPPVLTLPADITATTTVAAGASVAYAVTAVDDVSGLLVPACKPASGSLFPRGTTAVACSVADGSGNIATGSFRVTVICRLTGDLDGDCDVDSNDVNIVFAARGQKASSAEDPRDLDRDGLITVIDARRLALLCTRPRCAVQ